MNLFSVFALVVTLNAQVFESVTDSVVTTDGGDSRSVNWIDLDSDGDLDLFVTNGHNPGQNNFLYINKGKGSFEKVCEGALVEDGARSDGSSWGDIDGDGDLDAYVANWYNDLNLLYINDHGRFKRSLDGPLSWYRGFSESCAWGDYDGDGDLDLFVANSGSAMPTANALFLNVGNLTFHDVPDQVFVASAQPSRMGSWVDVDGDRDLDLFVVNENNAPNELLLNQLHPTGRAEFERAQNDPLVTSQKSSISASWADIDNDGDFDVFIANLEQDNQLYINHSGTFKPLADVVSTEGGHSFGSSWGDFDNDGDLDLFVANGWGEGPQTNFLYENQWMETGQLRFKKVTSGPIVTETGWSYGSSFADYDNDGDLDLFVAKWLHSKDENNALYRNQGNANRSLQLNCVAKGSNTAALGAVVTVKASIGGRQVSQTRQISGQDSYCGQNLRLHFGLGQATQVTEISIRWPSGDDQSVAHVEVGGIITLKQSD